MLGENEDSYVQSYSCSIAEKMEDSLQPLRVDTMAIQGSQSAYWDWLGLKGIKKLGVGGFLSL